MKILSSAFNFVKAITPPLVREVLIVLRNHRSLRFFGKVYTGTFATFAEVGRNFHRVVPYNSAESEREEIARFALARTAILAARHNVIQESAERFTLLGALAATLSDPMPTILDIGGAIGDTLARLAYSCPQLKPRLIVYELPAIARAGREAFRDDPTVRFVDNLTEVDRADIVFISGALQYFEDYKSLLSQVCILRPKIIVVAYTLMTDAPTFVTAQVNTRLRVIPNWVINRDELVAQLNALRFDLIYRGQAQIPATVHLRNFPASQNTSFFNMVFQTKP